MKFVSIQKNEPGDRVRVSATVVWEDNDGPSEQLFFETVGEAALMWHVS
jgi:hypothetical protein